MTGRRSFIQRAAGAALVAAPGWPRLAQAQTGAEWPSKVLRIVVPYPAGGLTDNLARLLAERLRPLAPQGVVVDNRPGAGTLLAASQVAKAPPDGHTLLMATSTTLGISQGLFANPMIQIGDLGGIGMLGAVTLYVLVRPDSPATTIAELITTLKARPDQYSYGSPGNGTPHHLLSELLKTRAGLATPHVPYNGSVAAMTDLIAGRVEFAILDASVAQPQIQAGKLRPLATTAPKRSPIAPQVPALTETYADIDLQVWQGLVGPNGVPADVVDKLNGEVNRALASPDFRARVVAMGVEPLPLSVEQFNTLIRSDGPRWRDLVKKSGAKVD